MDDPGILLFDRPINLFRCEPPGCNNCNYHFITEKNYNHNGLVILLNKIHEQKNQFFSKFMLKC